MPGGTSVRGGGAATAAQRGTSVRTGGGQAALRLQLHGAAAAGRGGYPPTLARAGP